MYANNDVVLFKVSEDLANDLDKMKASASYEEQSALHQWKDCLGKSGSVWKRMGGRLGEERRQKHQNISRPGFDNGRFYERKVSFSCICLSSCPGPEINLDPVPRYEGVCGIGLLGSQGLCLVLMSLSVNCLPIFLLAST